MDTCQAVAAPRLAKRRRAPGFYFLSVAGGAPEESSGGESGFGSGVREHLLGSPRLLKDVGALPGVGSGRLGRPKILTRWILTQGGKIDHVSR